MVRVSINVVVKRDASSVSNSFDDVVLSDKAAKKLVNKIKVAILEASNYRYPVK